MGRDGELRDGWQNDGRLFPPDEVVAVANFHLSDAPARTPGEAIMRDRR